MALNPYDSCPCGTGKKFKWCCSNYWEKIQKVLTLFEQGQMEVGQRQMEALFREFPKQPQLRVYFANMYLVNHEFEKCEQILEPGFASLKEFPMGLFLKGVCRQNEGEYIGALLLFRQAAEQFPEDAHDLLAQVYEFIAQNEQQLNRPLAASFAWNRILHLAPGDPELHQQYETAFGQRSSLPECARKTYELRPTLVPISINTTARLSVIKAAYTELSQQVPLDPAVWFNLGLVQAWLGELGTAYASMQESLKLEYNDELAQVTATIMQILACGHGMEADADFLEFSIVAEVRDPQALTSYLRNMEQENRLTGIRIHEEQSAVSGIFVEPVPSLVDTGLVLGKIQCHMMMMPGMIRLSGCSEARVRQVSETMQTQLNLAMSVKSERTIVAHFADLYQEAFLYPVRMSNFEEAVKKLSDHVQNFLENDWINTPRRYLSGVSPLDAVGSKVLRKHLLGLLKFTQDSLEQNSPKQRTEQGIVSLIHIDFARLWHKLGIQLEPPGAPSEELLASVAAANIAPPPPIIPVAAASPPEAAPEPAIAKAKDFSLMNVGELAAVPFTDLTVPALEEAMRAAVKLDARELAVAIAKVGVTKPIDPAKPDRYPFYACAMTGAISESQFAEALSLAQAGAEYDLAHNEGKRATEFSTRKAQLYAKCNQADESAKEYDTLIERFPNEPKYLVAAIESMLSLKRVDFAEKYLEQGMALAKSSGNRDLEGACLELSEAAKRMRS